MEIESNPEAEEAAAGQAADEPLAEPALASAAETAVISGLGYISCPTAPWNAIAAIGRITTWPANKEERFRSVSCRCYLHSSCVSPAKGRSKVTNEQLIAWLLSGEIPPAGASSAAKTAMGVAHKAKFAEFLNQ